MKGSLLGNPNYDRRIEVPRPRARSWRSGLSMKISGQPIFRLPGTEAKPSLPQILFVRALRFSAGGATLFPARALGQTGDHLVQPEENGSRNGILDAILTAAPGTVRLGNFTFPGTLYNGSYLPPLLRARTGDLLRITFRNHLPDDPSNLHFHGMTVSPKGIAIMSSSMFILARTSNLRRLGG